MAAFFTSNLQTINLTLSEIINQILKNYDCFDTCSMPMFRYRIYLRQHLRLL